MKRLEVLLRDRIGLQAESIGASAVEAAFRARSGESGIADPDTYALHVETDNDEFERFIDEVVVPETWFFRDGAAFEFLRKSYLMRSKHEEPYKVLSLPCATGEEPYSIAMTLLDAKVANHFQIHAVDVSRAVLQTAHRAIYTTLSFRSTTAGHERHFETVADGRRLTASIRQRVQFEHGNVLDPSLQAGNLFDAVFCRNLLIYLDRASRLRALTNLQRLMREEGVLFLGHAEGAIALELGFRTLDTLSFAFAKPTKTETGAKAPAMSLTAETSKMLSPKRSPNRTLTGYRVQAPLDRPLTPPTPAFSPPSASLQSSLAEARALADRGDLGEARKHCEALMAQAGPCAEGYALLGVIHLATGDASQALHSFGRALYLDAGHHESLVHSALIHERTGNLREAAQFRRRAERTLRKGTA